MVQAIDTPSKMSYLLVRFTFGDPSSPEYQAYTDWTSSVPGNPTYVSTPDMEIKIAPNVAHIDKDKVVNIAIPYQRFGNIIDGWVDELINGVAYSPVFVQIWEVTLPLRGGEAGTKRYIYRGRLIRTIRNYQGNPEKGVLQFATIKSRLQVSLGLPCEHHCVWTLYHTNTCAKAKGPFTSVLTPTGIDGKVLIVSSPPAKTGDWFRRGWAEYGGVRIGIYQWDGDGTNPDEFILLRQPPSTWIGKPVSFLAGCNKTYAQCVSRFANQARFGGMGIGMLSYNPVFENPE